MEGAAGADMDGVRVVALPAKIDVANAMEVRDALARELGDGVRLLVADLGETARLTLEGLQVLVLARAMAARHGTQLRLAAAQPQVRSYLDMTGTRRMFACYASLAEACAAPR